MRGYFRMVAITSQGGQMTPQERTEKILTYLPGDLFDYRTYIEGQIEEALEDQLVERISRLPDVKQAAYEQGKEEGWNAAREICCSECQRKLDDAKKQEM